MTDANRLYGTTSRFVEPVFQPKNLTGLPLLTLCLTDDFSTVMKYFSDCKKVAEAVKQ
ncbi:MAG: hypothetical protein V3U65_04620 [Granulosicoccaceae bacterium]